MSTKTETNQAAAKICGHEVATFNESNVYVYTAEVVAKPKLYENLRFKERFDIFTNPSDREATVISLARYAKYIMRTPEDLWYVVDGYGFYEMIEEGQRNTPYKTYQQALVAAVESVGGL